MIVIDRRDERPPGAYFMNLLKMPPDPWQIDVLDGKHRRLLLNCCRQSGKSTVVAMLALLEALFRSSSLILVLSKSLRQSSELLRKVAEFHLRLNSPLRDKRTRNELFFKNGSRIVCLPCSEPTIRGFSNVHMIIIDEAARVPTDLYQAVRPMTAVSNEGRIICLSTPFGKRGFFYDCWSRHDEWTKIEIPATQISRISEKFLAEERRAQSKSWFRQEYLCSFEALEGVVYPDFANCVVHIGGSKAAANLHPVVPAGRKVGGMDWGFRNPFAAIWGILDRDDVLWITGEHYEHERPLSYLIQKIPRDVSWYADPSGTAEIIEMVEANFIVNPGRNPVRLGIGAVKARLENGTLRVVAGACPNLLREAELYRYGDDAESRRAEKPLDNNDHALDALRYLIATIDQHKLGRKPKIAGAAQGATTQRPGERKWLSLYNEALWTTVWTCGR
jgi:hypothetical protein